MYPPDSVVHLLKPGPGVDQLPSVSTVMSPKIISAKQTCLQWTCTSPSHHQSPSLSSLPLPWVLACTLIVTCKWQRVMNEPEICMTLDSQSFLRLYLWANWRAKGVVLIITFFCIIIHRCFWLSMLVPSFFMCSCSHVLLLSTVQQQQANLMLLLQRAKKVPSDSLGLVDLAIRIVNSVFNLPDEQVVMFYKEFE